ncbi:glycoside hydrolase family 1 protein [Lachnoclostridium sp.]|uniref:glycoside hydrolase family 1 protein n=1 Tax=Lachnoclostridium sp. TaxID=2028282 RepID=UPI0028997DE5|nr:family 1 glycosylhydrolase [Lachnoclostridium sp.]
MAFQLLPGMQLGVASAPAQIEGGDVDHSWNNWYHLGHIQDGSSPQRANQHWERWQEDIELMQSMGIKRYRLGIEWARLEPKENNWNKEAVKHYRKLLTFMKSQGIEPLLTLHHFTNPMWFEKRGGFTKEENIRAFLRYVSFAVRSFGDLVSEYITINEPNVYATLGYFGGGFPPGENSVLLTSKVMSVMATCHIKSYRMIHRIRSKMGYNDTKVGFAHHARVFAPENPKNPLHISYTVLSKWMFQGALAKACLTGQFLPPLKNISHVPHGQYADFHGLNYYTRSTINKLGDGVAKNCPKNDLEWEIYPHGIVSCAQELYSILKRPIYITENGTCDNQDTFRSRYIYEHLKALCASNLPITRYYHWCFCDNFEWLEGESARFGIVHIDYETQARTIKQSGRFYSEIIEQGGVTERLYEKYVHEEEYHS